MHEAVENAVIELYRQGVPVMVITRSQRIARWTVYRILKSRGEPLRRAARMPSFEERGVAALIERHQALYEDSVTREWIARELERWAQINL